MPSRRPNERRRAPTPGETRRLATGSKESRPGARHRDETVTTVPQAMAVTTTSVQDNPLLEGLEVRRAPDPCILVIFGASGDLTKRKLFPALYSLASRRLLPEHFAVVGAARSAETDEDFKERMKEAVQENARDDFRDDVWELLADGMRYVPLDFADDQGEDELARTLTELDGERGTRGNRVYYLATPPVVFPTVVQALGKRRSTEGWRRLII